jgi:hypothetical protein
MGLKEVSGAKKGDAFEALITTTLHDNCTG